MKKGRQSIGAILCAFALSAASRPAAAQQQPTVAGPPLVEVWGSAIFAITGSSAAVVTSYSPPLLLSDDFTSHGGQTLAADARSGWGASGGINLFPGSRFGLQVLVDRTTGDVSAANAPYVVALDYVTRPPPTGELQTVSINQSIAWPDTSGALTQWAVAFNAVARAGPADRVSVILSAGPAYYRVSGDVQPLAFTTFRLGGHSVLFQDDYRLEASVGPGHRLGFDLGVELNAALGKHAAIITGYRYFGGPQLDVVVRPTAILNGTELIDPQSIGEIAARLGPMPTRISISGSRVFFGLKLRR